MHPLTITMWDFSWLERRWPGAGFEDWDRALDELQERGYDVIRIDPYPHLLCADPERTWTLKPVWTSNDWGCPHELDVTIWEPLRSFLQKCQDRRIRVALSSWFREDLTDERMSITSSARMAEIWIATLDLIRDANLLETIIYVDLCNEWPGDLWAPYFTNDPPWQTWTYWHTATSRAYMTAALNQVRARYPEIPLCFSLDGTNFQSYHDHTLPPQDLMEHHLWMAHMNNEEFTRALGTPVNPRFTESAYDLLAQRALKLYEARPTYWQDLLRSGIHQLAEASRIQNLPLVTTEAWALVDYKDHPQLEWGFIKALCQIGSLTSADTGRWIMVCTSNFACPQFTEMWDDIAWHRSINDAIHQVQLDPSIMNEVMRARMTL